MTTSNRTVELETRGQGDVRDLTAALSGAIRDAGVKNGLATIFVVGSTAGITTLEFEPGVAADLDRAYERIAARRAEYQHHLRWGDGNGSSHVRAAMLGPSLTVPIVDGRPTLGTWQQAVLVEFDTGPRRRAIVIQLLGE
ncbi:MAG: secondary thiamine-phosphate synthase enzyme YjbQ [Acidobacteriota bacterium]